MSGQWLEHFPSICSRSTVWGKIQPNYNPAMQGEMLQGGEDTLSLPSAAHTSPLHTVLHGDALLIWSISPLLKHHLLTAPVVALHHVGALIVGGWKGLCSNAGLVAHLAVCI